MSVKLIFFGVGLSLLFYSCSLTSPDTTQVNQFTSDTSAIGSYVRQNKISATKLTTGIWFAVDSLAKGIRPVFNDSVTISYTMKILSSGVVVDQSSSPVTIPLMNWLGGVQATLPQFQEGSKGRIFIPSYYGYGNAANGSVPPNTNLLFDFKIHRVYDHQLQIDTVAIDAYLKANSINALKDASGIRYTFDTLGIGSAPSITDFVTFTYTAKLLNSSSVIDQVSSPVKASLQSLILGWQIGLRYVQEGSTVTLYVPSRLAYGSASQSSIPANSNLVFKIRLVKVSQN